VRTGELSLGQNFEGLLPWGDVDNRPFLRCMPGTAYAGGVRVGSKRPNQGVRGLIGPFRDSTGKMIEHDLNGDGSAS
jgi:hypothetical protein